MEGVGQSKAASSFGRGVKVLSTGKTLPSLVIILSVLWATLGILSFIMGIVYIVVFQFWANNPLLSLVLTSLTSLYVRIIIILIFGGVLYFFVGRGLWKGQAWARIAAIILLLLGAVWTIWVFVKSLINTPELFSTSMGIWSIIFTLMSLAFSLVLASYFAFNQGVKKGFAK